MIFKRVVWLALWVVSAILSFGLYAVSFDYLTRPWVMGPEDTINLQVYDGYIVTIEGDGPIELSIHSETYCALTTDSEKVQLDPGENKLGGEIRKFSLSCDASARVRFLEAPGKVAMENGKKDFPRSFSGVVATVAMFFAGYVLVQPFVKRQFSL
ncbi:MAG: hypothetical protein AAB443_04165 [Patescibacteria group bacterium]|mgnify:CR=1 FL=1